jgi:hypothetical protein
MPEWAAKTARRVTRGGWGVKKPAAFRVPSSRLIQCPPADPRWSARSEMLRKLPRGPLCARERNPRPWARHPEFAEAIDREQRNLRQPSDVEFSARLRDAIGRASGFLPSYRMARSPLPPGSRSSRARGRGRTGRSRRGSTPCTRRGRCHGRAGVMTRGSRKITRPSVEPAADPPASSRAWPASGTAGSGSRCRRRGCEPGAELRDPAEAGRGHPSQPAAPQEERIANAFA